MGKVCLVFVLSLVFVFSTSAQSIKKLENNPDAESVVKVNPDVTETKNISSETTETQKINNETAETQKVSSETTEVKKVAPDATETKVVVETKITVETKTEPVQEPVKKEETDNSKTEKTPSPVKKESSSASVLRMLENTSLGKFSTGDAAIDSYIEAACERYNIDPLLIYAQMNQESGFKRKATSNKGASGLMQLMPDTAIRFGVRNIYNPKQNIEAGVKYMRWLLDQFGGDVRLALAAYNAGEGSVKKYGNQIPPYRETKSYVARITAHYAQITSQILNPNVAVSEGVD